MRLEPRTVRYGGAMFDRDEIDAVMAQLSNPMGLIPGAKVCEFEQRVAAYMGKSHGVMVNSGSSALTTGSQCGPNTAIPILPRPPNNGTARTPHNRARL